MNKNFITECLNVIDQIKEGSYVAITQNGSTSKYRVDYIEDEYCFELTYLDQENVIWDGANNLDYLKESLLIDAIDGKYQKIEIL